MDEATAGQYARITAQLRQQNQLIGTNDLWIAAAAVANGLELVKHRAFRTRDGSVHTRILRGGFGKKTEPQNPELAVTVIRILNHESHELHEWMCDLRDFTPSLFDACMILVSS